MAPAPKELAKRFAHVLLGDYSPYFIYCGPEPDNGTPQTDEHPDFSVQKIDDSDLAASDSFLLREQHPYLGEGTVGYGCFIDGQLAGACFYWHGKRYLQRNFWPLSKGEAKLVQIVTIPEMRGRGVARQLIAGSYQQMRKAGFTRVYARIWHSNTPSIRAFQRAGWQRIALVVEINPLRRERPLRLRFRL